MLNKTRSATLMLCATAAIGLAGCGGGEGVQAFCDLSDEFVNLNLMEDIDPTDADALRAELEEAQSSVAELVDVAPEAIADGVAAMQDGFDEVVTLFEDVNFDITQMDPSDNAAIDEIAQQYEEAGDRIDDWTDENCTTS